MTCALPRVSCPCTWPRRPRRSPITPPVNSSGVTTSTFMIRAAGLLLVRVVDGDRLRQRLAIGHLRRADGRVDLVGAPENVDFDLEVKLAHAFEDGLPGIDIGGDAEGRILLRQSVERDA